MQKRTGNAAYMDQNINISTTKVNEWRLPLRESFKEIKAAESAYQAMVRIGITDFHEYEQAWRDFLHALERFWNKIELECKGRPQWQRIREEYVYHRKNDDLLLYLRQARNASEHTLSPVIKEWDANLRTTPLSGAIQLEWDPWDRPLLPVTNRGKTYEPPKQHLGKPLEDYRRVGCGEARIVGELALNFYVGAFGRILNEAFLKP